MIGQFLSIGLITLLGAMLPGPDFAIVVKNTIFYSRKSGLLTSIGVGAAILVHMSYCIFGLAIMISSSLMLFCLIKYTGAAYLIYLGINSLLSKQSKNIFQDQEIAEKKDSHFTAFKQGFLCNLLNPKATLFFLALFTVVIKPDTPIVWQIAYGLEIPAIAILWFCSLTIILSHSPIKLTLQKIETYIAKTLGLFLIGFGLSLAFIGK